jgi:hypothetical protein
MASPLAWDRLEAWERRIEAAAQRNQPGDILLLADEAPVRPLRLRALRTATRVLVGLKSHKLAIKIAERALALTPDDVVVRQQKAIAEAVNAALNIPDDAVSRYEKPNNAKPKRVVLFSGHMLDHPDTRGPGKAKPERFPASKVDAAGAALSAQLDAMGAEAGDVGLCGGACGGDILFAEACLARGMRLHVFIPESEPKFLQNSVSFAGPDWQERFFAAVHRPEVEYRVQPEALGDPLPSSNIYDRNNRWLTYTAMVYGSDRLRVLCLWNRQAGDGSGGTEDMVKLVNDVACATPVIVDPTNL